MYIVTLCNSPAAESLLFRFIPGEGLSPIKAHTGTTDLHAIGITGVCPLNGGYLVSLQSPTYSLAYFDKDFHLIRAASIDEISDPHGLISLEGNVYVVSTGTNQIVELSQDLKFLKFYETIGESDIDIDHINDICSLNGEIYISCFGKISTDGLRCGVVTTVRSGINQITNMNEPHSVTVFNGEMFVLDSATGSIVKLYNGAGFSVVSSISGYARGLALSQDHLIVGRSSPRKRNRTSTKRVVLRHYSDKFEKRKAEHPGVFCINRHNWTAEYYPLIGGGAEIYGICPEHTSTIS